jgi:hypothetical protein
LVYVVTSKNTPHNLINAGLTIRELVDNGRKPKPLLVGEDPEQFWSKLAKYIDRSDNSLIILDMPHPEDAGHEKVAVPHGSVVIYVPSELNAPSIEERQRMIEWGIAVAPERKSSECFLGDLTDENRKWREISSIISLEQKPKRESEERSRIVKGIIDASIRSPHDAIWKIASDDMDYFKSLGADGKPDIRVQAKDGWCDIEVKKDSPENFGEIFQACLECKADPVAITGGLNAIFTVKPTFVTQIAGTYAANLKAVMTFGKGCILRADGSFDREAMIFLAGKADRQRINLKIDPPRLVSEKTLHRRLVGGETSQEVQGKKYVKLYHSLKETFPGLDFIAKDLLSVPSEAFEETVALLHESGSSYEIIEK